MTALDLVVMDLDDTCYPQSEYLHGVLAQVAYAGSVKFGFDENCLLSRLLTQASLGSDKGGVIDGALIAMGVPQEQVERAVPTLVDAFKQWQPQALGLYPGVKAAIRSLRESGVPVAILTDGDAGIQQAKIEALGIEAIVDGILISDTLGGRAFRKPNPEGLLSLMARFSAAAARTIMIGDRPEKDIQVALNAGCLGIRVKTGEYAARPDIPETFKSFPDLALAVEDLLVPSRLGA